MFGLYVEGDGYITRQEMEQCIHELELGTVFEKELVNQMFSEADLNQDGKISFEGKIQSQQRTDLEQPSNLLRRLHPCFSLQST